MTTENEFSGENKNIGLLSSRSGDLDSTNVLPLSGKPDLEKARCFISAQQLLQHPLNPNTVLQSFWTSVSLSIK